MPKVSVIQASMLYKVTNRTVYNWIKEDKIDCEDGLYDLDKLQKAHDRRRTLKHLKRFAIWLDFTYSSYNWLACIWNRIMVTTEANLEEIDEALEHLRERLQDRYGNRLTYQQRQLYLSSVDDLLDARLALVSKSL